MLRKAFRFVGEEPLMTSWGSDILSEIRAKKKMAVHWRRASVDIGKELEGIGWNITRITKEGSLVICHNMDEPERYGYVSQAQRRVWHDLVSM